MDRMEIAREYWGADVPDWIRALVVACDAPGASQNRVAKRLGYTGGVVSQLLRKAYPGNLDRIEDRVRAIYMGGQIACPALGEIGSAACLDWRDRSVALGSVSPMAVRMFRACRACPRNRAVAEEDAA
ncbi:hypothetical protein QO034_06380 [Sedimentitalea sp. JM2-8]|uniref:Transcriptional regulator n=1 Tax=Sedimentitalea xiamensis TaxID=3050037 RepID=A0ABT7FC83_9RHOB|nr:hypothetical protein [Sedimentitalea xiamensis]MDK3072730.1 hypothetical protein [Sedimentitalea xiamensis]